MADARSPLPGVGQGNLVVDALDALDARHEARHQVQLVVLGNVLGRIVGGAVAGVIGIAVLALLLVGESSGVDTAPVVQAAESYLQIRPVTE